MLVLGKSILLNYKHLQTCIVDIKLNLTHIIYLTFLFDLIVENISSKLLFKQSKNVYMFFNIHEWNCQSAKTLLFQFHGVIIIQL